MTTIPLNSLFKNIVNLEYRLEKKINSLPRGILCPADRSSVLRMLKIAHNFAYHLAWHTAYDQKSDRYPQAQKILEGLFRTVHRALKRPPKALAIAASPQQPSRPMPAIKSVKAPTKPPKPEPTGNRAVHQQPIKTKRPSQVSGIQSVSRGQNIRVQQRNIVKQPKPGPSANSTVVPQPDKDQLMQLAIENGPPKRQPLGSSSVLPQHGARECESQMEPTQIRVHVSQRPTPEVEPHEFPHQYWLQEPQDRNQQILPSLPHPPEQRASGRQSDHRPSTPSVNPMPHDHSHRSTYRSEFSPVRPTPTSSRSASVHPYQLETYKP